MIRWLVGVVNHLVWYTWDSFLWFAEVVRLELVLECGSDLIRVGECLQCGECCRRLGWLLVHADDDTIEWIRARDPEIQVVPDEDVKDYCWVSIPYPCTSLMDLGDGRFHCKLQDSKPAQCKRYPEATDELKPACGYRFISSESAAESLDSL